MPIVTVSLPWLSLALALGGVGGLLNAALTDNLRLWPSFVGSGAGGRRAIRVGLVANVCLAAVASTACVWALAGLGSFAPTPNSGQLLALLSASVCIGFGAARLTTNEADKRLLHEAVCKASAAPAAPPDTVRAMETAQPWAIYLTTDTLMPPPMATWRVGR
jgi:hypothetical protein